jgi:hypothetical protein
MSWRENAEFYRANVRENLIVAGTLTVTGAQTFTGAQTLTGLFTANGGIALGANGLARTGRERWVPAGIGKIGGTAGWALTANDLAEATVAASQTASTFVLPLTGLTIGDTVTSFKVVAQIESAGNTATLDADLRKLTNAAGDPTDASIGAITQVSVTADTAVAAEKTGLTEVVAATEALYVLLTATTAASTDIRLLGITYTVTEA